MKSAGRFSLEIHMATASSFLEMRRIMRETSSDMLKMEILGYIASSQLAGGIGTNPHSIAEITGIPRETVRRKVQELIAKGVVVRSGPRLVRISDPAFADYLLLLDKLAEVMFKFAQQSEI